MRRPIVGIVGAGEASERSLRDARGLGWAVARRGWIVLTGGRAAGVMAAACAGAKEVPGSLTLGILPSDAGGVGPDVDVAVFTGMGDARNVVNVLTSDAVVACGVEGAGTASEVALALKSAKPVILLAAGERATAFFRGLHGGERLLTAASVEDTIHLLETEIGLRPMPGSSSS
ncbi:MAG: cytochrome [Gemmatimonadales bacterium]